MNLRNIRAQACLCLAVTASIASTNASAELVDRGGGLLYDTVLNLTWLQDANFAQTSGFDADGRLGSGDAFSWVEHLSYFHAPSGKTITGWRLPTVSPSNGVAMNYDNRFDGNSDNGYNIASPQSELGYMFYVNLGLKGLYDKSGAQQSGCCVPAAYGETVDVGLVRNLRNYAYWTQTPYEGSAPGYYWWVFSMNRGSQDPYENNYPLIPWAVTTGDVAAVPEPSSGVLWMVGAAVLGMRLLPRRNRGTDRPGGPRHSV